MRRITYLIACTSIFMLLFATPCMASSIWDSRGEHFKDYKAFKAGDIVTVLIDESSSATNKAGTKTAKDSSMSVSATAGTGLWSTFLGFGTNGGYQDSYKGEGETTRSGNLSGKISVRVMEVLPNANLMVEGQRVIVVNREIQKISITGIIRPRDVGADNVVNSSLVADAEITYDGSGVVAEKQQVGVLTRLLGWLWIF